MEPATRDELKQQIDAISRDARGPMMPHAETIAPRYTEAGQGEAEPFGRWLLAQRDRGDWIDDLATAARSDRGFPKNGTPKDVGDRMQILGADADAFEQLEDAERVWASL